MRPAEPSGASLPTDPHLAPLADRDEAQALTRRISASRTVEDAAHLTTRTPPSRRSRPRGVPLLAGTDAPNPGTTHGASLHRELELLVAAGLTPIEALTAATSTPARVFGLRDRGRIAPGLRADLLLVDGEPVDDITDDASASCGSGATARPSRARLQPMRLRLLPRDGYSWTGYIWLVYLSAPLWFAIVQPTSDAGACSPTTAASAFLPLYFWGFWLERWTVLVPIAAIAAIGVGAHSRQYRRLGFLRLCRVVRRTRRPARPGRARPPRVDPGCRRRSRHRGPAAGGLGTGRAAHHPDRRVERHLPRDRAPPNARSARGRGRGAASGRRSPSASASDATSTICSGHTLSVITLKAELASKLAVARTGALARRDSRRRADFARGAG